MNELKDHIEAQRFLYNKSFSAKMDKGVALLMVGFGIFAVIAVGPLWWTLIWFPLAIAEWFDLLSLSRLRTKIDFRRNPKFREEYHLTFSSEDIHFQTASIEATLKWTHYDGATETPDLFLLMYGKGLYTLIPKRAFKSETELRVFRVLVSEKIPT